MNSILTFRYTFLGLFICFFYFAYTQVSFSNDASEIGINVVCGISLFGSGINFFDYDNDGCDDITIASAQGDPVRFLKNIN